MPSPDVSVEELLRAGVHLGSGRIHPGMRRYLKPGKLQVRVFDLRESIKALIRAWHFLKNLAARRRLVLFVGTKRAARSSLKEQARRCRMPYVDRRWIGGTLTNYEQLRSRIERLRERNPRKKETARQALEFRSLDRRFGGLASMTEQPACLVVLDPRHEAVAVKEATKLGLAIVALLDLDGDPGDIDLPIPGNAASAKSIELVVRHLADAILEGKRPPPPEQRPRSKRPPGNGPEGAPVPARLRPRPTPGRARSAKPEP